MAWEKMGSFSAPSPRFCCAATSTVRCGKKEQPLLARTAAEIQPISKIQVQNFRKSEKISGGCGWGKRRREMALGVKTRRKAFLFPCSFHSPLISALILWHLLCLQALDAAVRLSSKEATRFLHFPILDAWAPTLSFHCQSWINQRRRLCSAWGGLT
jgi:hypothetical protein